MSVHFQVKLCIFSCPVHNLVKWSDFIELCMMTTLTRWCFTYMNQITKFTKQLAKLCSMFVILNSYWQCLFPLSVIRKMEVIFHENCKLSCITQTCRSLERKTSAVSTFSYLQLEGPTTARTSAAKPACHRQSELVAEQYSSVGKCFNKANLTTKLCKRWQLLLVT